MPATSPSDRAVDLSRRSVLAAGIAGAGAVTLAACGGGGTSPSTPKTKAGQAVAKLDDIPVGGAISAQLNGDPVIVSRPTSSTAACFSAICTHQGCTVRPQGAKAVCPCHGSVFNALTGKVIQTPAPSPLPSVAVEVNNGTVVTKSGGTA
jgi:Rieske Fe-S protein